MEPPTTELDALQKVSCAGDEFAWVNDCVLLRLETARKCCGNSSMGWEQKAHVHMQALLLLEKGNLCFTPKRLAAHITTLSTSLQRISHIVSFKQEARAKVAELAIAKEKAAAAEAAASLPAKVLAHAITLRGIKLTAPQVCRLAVVPVRAAISKQELSCQAIPAPACHGCNGACNLSTPSQNSMHETSMLNMSVLMPEAGGKDVLRSCFLCHSCFCSKNRVFDSCAVGKCRVGVNRVCMSDTVHFRCAPRVTSGDPV